MCFLRTPLEISLRTFVVLSSFKATIFMYFLFICVFLYDCCLDQINSNQIKSRHHVTDTVFEIFEKQTLFGYCFEKCVV